MILAALSGGAIAGIVIAILFVLGVIILACGLAFFAVSAFVERKRSPARA